MTGSLDRIKAEIESLGYRTLVSSSPQGEVVSFEYKVEAGPHRNRTVRVGVSMHGHEGYPEYPPHWVHISPPIEDGQGGAVARYTDAQDREWVAMSRPPGPLWDQLPTKHMRLFLTEHLRRLWAAM